MCCHLAVFFNTLKNEYQKLVGKFGVVNYSHFLKLLLHNDILTIEGFNMNEKELCLMALVI
jgi:hypothetical protein